MKDLIEIRCPFKVTNKKTGKMYDCNFLCVKVYPGSSGETWCRICKLSYEFEVDEQSVNITKVHVKK